MNATSTSILASTAADPLRPTKFPMQIQGGMLEALGINMYTSIGKCLVEFIANAYDSDAASVDVRIPYERIAASRKAARAMARDEALAAGEDTFKVLLAPLPEDIVIEIVDTGHGMSPADIHNKFMPINRKRRSDAEGSETIVRSESGRRHVMGRKGLGKLAGFGAAEIVEVSTKRAGETYSTTFVMAFEELRNSANLANVEIPATYTDGLELATKGTTIRLRRLKCDAVKQTADTILETIASAFFGVKPEDFKVTINDGLVQETTASYEYVYAPGADASAEDRPADGFARRSFEIEDVGTVSFDYLVKFRARERDAAAPSLAFGSLPAAKRGARIYCNNRLAAGPSLLSLKTGMHNFYATDYLECIVRADEIDRRTIDFINTNRTQLREDNEVVQTLIEQVTDVMAKAIAGHAAWRERKISAKIDTKIQSTPTLRWIETLPRAQRDAARKVLKVIAFNYDLNSPEFEEVAPNLFNAVTANDVLIRLIELRNDPRSIERIASHLVELGEVERGHVLSHYRGRRSAIDALSKLVEGGELTRAGGPRTEKQLHQLLKINPWLVRPDLSGYVSSDVAMTTTLSKLASELGVDDFAKPHIAEGNADTTRPDLVFLLGDTINPHVVTVVELKSPTIALDFDHLRQLRRYMRQIQTWMKNELKRDVDVQGMLVGRMPDSSPRVPDQAELQDEIAQRGPTTKWEVVGLQEMLVRTRTVHMDMIKSLEKEADEASTATLSAPTAEAVVPNRYNSASG